MAKVDQFPAVFAQLKGMLKHFEAQLSVQADEPEQYSLAAPNAKQPHKPELFAMVQIRKNYVSYHLIPVYTFPALLDEASPDLKRRMQGKSCFNFTALDDVTLGELAHLTERSFKQIKQHDAL